MVYTLNKEDRESITKEIYRGMQRDLITLELNMEFHGDIELPKYEAELKAATRQKDQEKIRFTSAMITAEKNKLEESKDTHANTLVFLGMLEKRIKAFKK